MAMNTHTRATRAAPDATSARWLRYRRTVGGETDRDPANVIAADVAAKAHTVPM
jgi:hypothetical protein